MALWRGVMGVVAVLSMTVPAWAQDWTGIYYGTHTGVLEGDTSVTDVDGFHDPVGTTFSDSRPGHASGIHLGYNHDLGMLILGVEADIDSVGFETFAIQHNTAASGFFRDGDATSTIEWMGSIRGRIGVTPWQHLLLYGTGGYAWADVSYETTSTFFGAVAPADSSTGSSESGWVAGGGAELAISRGTTARIEYLHYDFDRATAVTPNGDRFAFDTDLDVVRFGLSYRLGSGESPFESLMAGSIDSLKDGGEMPADWTGLYLGGHLGALDSDNEHVDVDGDQDLAGTAHDSSGYGYVAGVHAGYNWDVGMLVIGAEADVSLADSETSVILDNTPASGGDRDGLAITTIDSLASIRGRVGINPWERMHVFATGGIAWADIDNRIEDTVAGTGVPDPANSGSISSDSGWVAGAGLEVMLTSRLSSKTDFLHYDFGETSLVTPNGFEHRFSNELDVVRTGLSYRF